MRVIPNWVDTDVAHAAAARQRVGARATGSTGRFVVMHSGNVGHAQNLDNLIRATTFLRDLDDLRAVIVGFGARHAAARRARRAARGRQRALPARTSRASCCRESLSSADVHFVGLGKGLAGYVVPSRLYGILAVGRPVIVGRRRRERDGARRARRSAAGS